MKRVITLMVAAAMAFAVLAGTALAGGHKWGDVDPHGHVMLIGVEVVDGWVHFDRCVEFANGEALRVPAHHHSVHTGAAGGSPMAPTPGALFRSGKWVIPLSPFAGLPFTGCESFTSPFPAP